MKAQLLRMGVKPGRIISAPEMGLHAATELRYQAEKGENEKSYE